jgi:hypothetical protein
MATEVGQRPRASWAPRAGTASIWPGLMMVVAGAVQGDGAVLTAAYRGASPVSEDQLSFPWEGATAITTSLVWGAAQVLLLLGLIAFACTGVPNVRIGRAGAALAVAGATLYVLAHVLSVIAHDASLDDPVAIVVLTFLGIGTVLTAIGMLMAGTAIRRSGAWTGWRGFTPLALGAWMVLLVPLQFTAALPLAVGGYAVAVMALGVALIEEAR